VKIKTAVQKLIEHLNPREYDDWGTKGKRDIVQEHGRLLERVRPYTMTGVARVGALVDAVRYVVRRRIPGAFVECGVWRGGSVLAAILTLQELGETDRDIFLYDTFEGMTKPTAEDTSNFEQPALAVWDESENTGKRPWSGLFHSELFGEAQVRDLLLKTGYPEKRLHFVRGPVEQTIPGKMPERIALLRLDTDWYESTRHELEHLYPRLTAGGALIIDDYGYWEGCRKAVDEYFGRDSVLPVFLHRIDYTGRIAIKPE